MLKKILLTFILFVHVVAYGIDEGEESSAAKSSEWLKLLHNGRIQDANFYLSAESAFSPLEELKANLAQFKSDPQYSCLFPARAQFMSQRFDLGPKACAQVEAWKKTISGQSVALVYVTQYVSNPASAFGHTFLLFRSKDKPLNLHGSISNAAHMPEQVSDFDYIVKGMTGGFPAEFTADPFYLKIQEYNNIENRDMWIYDLNFSKQQTDQLLNHIWELSKKSNQGYLFLNKNCAVNSYHALAAIHPDLDFLPTDDVYVLPVETIVKVRSITTGIEYYPSLREKMALRSQLLSPGESQEFHNTISNFETFNPPKSIEVTALTLENFELLRTRQYGELTPFQNSAYQKTLLQRAELGSSSLSMSLPRPSEPHNVLPPRRIAVSGGALENQSVYSLAVSPFYHSLLERSAGYRPFSEFILLNAELQTIAETSRLDLTLVQMANFPVVTVFDSQWSWKFSSGFEQQERCERCWSFRGEGSIGKSMQLYSRGLLFGLFGVYQDGVSPLGPQFSAGGLSDFALGKFLYQARVLRPRKNSDFRTIVDVQANMDLVKNTNLELASSFEQDFVNYQLSLSHHF